MVRVTRDAKIIDLRRDGLTYVQIAPLVGVSKSTVADAIKRWMDANGPSAEQVEEMRQFQGAQLDAYQAQLAPHLMRPLRNDEGEIIYDGNGDDRKPIRVPDVQVGQMWLCVLERRAKLYGLDLQTGKLGKPQITAEMMAELFGYDTAEDPMDIEADEEMPDNGRRSALALATDAILTSVRVHQGDGDDGAPAPGAALEAAGRRILRAHLRRSKRRQVETPAPERGQQTPVPLAPAASTEPAARLFARL
jgi:hypothetical protein